MFKYLYCSDPSVALSAINWTPEESLLPIATAADGNHDNNKGGCYDEDADLMDEDFVENLKESWQEFLPIARSLLEKLEQCHTHLEPLVAPSD